MKSGWATPATWVLVFLLTVALVMLFQNPNVEHVAQRSYSQFVGMGPTLKSAIIRGDMLDGRDETGARFAVRLPRDIAFADRLAKNGTEVVSDTSAWLTMLLINGLPLLFYAAVWLYPLLRIARALEGLLARRAPTARADAMDAPPPTA